MTQKKLVETPIERYEAITVLGKPAFEDATTLRSLVATSLGDKAASSFAIPVRRGDQLFWTTTLRGAVRNWSALKPSEPSVLDEQRLSLGCALAQLVQSLSLPGLSTPQGYKAQLLYAALKVPSPQHVFAVGESVVIACWGLREKADSGFDPFGP